VQDVWGERALAEAVEQRAGGSLGGFAWERRWGSAARLLDEIVGGGYGSRRGNECPAVAWGWQGGGGGKVQPLRGGPGVRGAAWTQA